MSYLLGTKEYKRQWRLKNLERIRARERMLYAKNKERISERRKARRRLFPEIDRRHRTTFRTKHGEKLTEYYRLWKRNFRKNNPEKARADERRNYLVNPKRFIEKNRKRKTLKRNGVVADCSQKLKLLELERFCHWCRDRLTNFNRSIDHVIPLARGGHHVPENLVVACKKCNSSKGNKLIKEWSCKAA